MSLLWLGTDVLLIKNMLISEIDYMMGTSTGGFVRRNKTFGTS
jgi:hypothetical protein